MELAKIAGAKKVGFLRESCGIYYGTTEYDG
jgi:hypothetical protein